MTALHHLTERPQGAQYTGQTDVEPHSLWALYRTDSGRRIWHVIGAENESWWEEKAQ